MMSKNNENPNTDSVDAELREQVLLLIDKQTTAMSMNGKAYPKVSRESLADEYVQLLTQARKGYDHMKKCATNFIDPSTLMPGECNCKLYTQAELDQKVAEARLELLELVVFIVSHQPDVLSQMSVEGGLKLTHQGRTYVIGAGTDFTPENFFKTMLEKEKLHER